MFWVLFVFAFLISACGSEENPLANTEWRLVALGNADPPTEVAAGNPTAEFTTATDKTRVDGPQFLWSEIQRGGSGAAP